MSGPLSLEDSRHYPIVLAAMRGAHGQDPGMHADGNDKDAI